MKIGPARQNRKKHAQRNAPGLYMKAPRFEQHVCHQGHAPDESEWACVTHENVRGVGDTLFDDPFPVPIPRHH
jgi:hypothetical protein